MTDTNALDDLSPRERRHLKTRQAILDAALRIIREEGLDNLSMRGIADAIDYSVGALYKYFDSKDMLIGELCTDGFSRLAANMRQAIQGDMPITQKLIAAGQQYIHFAQNNPEVFRMMFDSMDSQPPAPGEDMDGLEQDDAFGILLAIVAEGVAQGVFPQDDNLGVREIAFQCWYVVHGMATLRLTMFTHADEGFDAMNTAILQANVWALTALKEA